ncbi:uncharacterized protein LY89DRAFT_732451 [Mollisia scopiformis]|uniref:Uncharacterized protein n=1 Tax=Mollisia scopiformis TaxID=149040 RepID=A0A194XGL2_MOLSC|nr:uncharacterized protein LY89DRAFT_732451 [Mollisia scopiformis]KUJ18912.1 hypothetical protein LY89DRAFT_732451 [Mollisia scopiformis]
MQYLKTLIIPLGLAASTLAKPFPISSDGYSASVKKNVTEQIAIWQSAIDTVNNFVDTVLIFANDSTEVSKMAVVAFAAAQEESSSNTILSDEVQIDASGEAASKALVPGFNIIGPAINDTIYQPQNVKKNVDTVNEERCAPPRGKGAISLEGDVQQAAASAVGIIVPPPQTPVACYLPAATGW